MFSFFGNYHLKILLLLLRQDKFVKTLTIYLKSVRKQTAVKLGIVHFIYNIFTATSASLWTWIHVNLIQLKENHLVRRLRTAKLSLRS